MLEERGKGNNRPGGWEEEGGGTAHRCAPGREGELPQLKVLMRIYPVPYVHFARLGEKEIAEANTVSSPDSSSSVR